MKDLIKKSSNISNMKKKIKRIKKNSKIKLFLKNILFFFLFLFILSISIFVFWISNLKIPDFNAFEERLVINSTKIYDRTGEVLLYDINKDIRRTSIPLEKMNINIKNATIAVEDSEFYKHKGVRPWSTLRAVFSNVSGVGLRGGGSTITQQLVKNTLLTSKKSVSRKIKEWILALKIDSYFPKDKILEFYLNEVPYGGTIYGIEEASKRYFGKSAIDLTLVESAYLASIPQAPSFLSPYGKNFDKLEERKNFVLFRMNTEGFINEEEYKNAREEVVEFQPQSFSNIKAPHFVFFIKDYLEEKYGKDIIERGGFNVITTLDYSIQEKAEEYVKEGALKNEKDWNGKNASLVAMDPKTGQILSMVGSRDYFDKEIDGNFNVAIAKRQPGSSFKPFIYATAFSKGFTPETVLFDLPTEFQTTCNAYGVALPGYSQKNCYMPQNYDGKWRGPISLRNALAQSINIPAVKLFYLSGLRDSLKIAEDMGISSLDKIERYGLTLVIGGGEVSLLDMTSAYGVLANNGIRNKYTGILEIKNQKGEIVEKYEEKPTQVLEKNIALTVSDILSDNDARVPTFGRNSSFVIPNYQVAGKTGTTNNNRDAWLLGYTPNLVVGVWAGNNDNTPMRKGGISMAGPIWNKFMTNVLPIREKEDFEEPQSLINENTRPVLRGNWQGDERFFIDKISGKLATEFTPEETKVEKTITNVHSILYWIDINNITGERPENPEKNPQFRNWETVVLNWWIRNSYNYKTINENDIPKEYDDVHKKYEINLILEEPNIETVHNKEDNLKIKILGEHINPFIRMDIFVNNVYIDSVKNTMDHKIPIIDIANLRNINELKINIYDSVYNKFEINSIFKVEL